MNQPLVSDYTVRKSPSEDFFQLLFDYIFNAAFQILRNIDRETAMVRTIYA